MERPGRWKVPLMEESKFFFQYINTSQNSTLRMAPTGQLNPESWIPNRQHNFASSNRADETCEAKVSYSYVAKMATAGTLSKPIMPRGGVL